MNLNEMRKSLNDAKYDFLRSDENLGKNIILMGLGGSYAYGTDTENSDVDIRGVATNTKRNILTRYDFEQVIDKETDTTIYSFEKIVKLLCACNPNTIEILGLKPDHYFFASDIGHQLIDNRKLFLSQIAAYSFGGYANDQLRRLENAIARNASQTQRETHILNSINNAFHLFDQKYSKFQGDAIKLYIDTSSTADLDSEIFIDVNLTHYPLRDYEGMMAEMKNIIKLYEKIGGRNERAITHNKLAKHMMHLVRLYLMCFDILENEEIITYRENEREFLMSIRNGNYLDQNLRPTDDFYDIVNQLEKRLQYDKQHTSLPERVDINKINDFVENINEKICNN